MTNQEIIADFEQHYYKLDDHKKSLLAKQDKRQLLIALAEYRYYKRNPVITMKMNGESKR